MKQLAVITNAYYQKLRESNHNSTALVSIDNMMIPLGIIDTTLDIKKLRNYKEKQITVHKIGFSLNYRDKSVIKIAWNLLNRSPKLNFLPIGSDFVGRVVDKYNYSGKIDIGDLVIPNCTYNESSKGIPTNCSSKEYQCFDESEISVINSNAVVETASVAGIGLITAHSMIRKAQIKKKEKILITSITSSTSQFLLKLLQKFYGNEIYAISFTGRANYLNGIVRVFNNEDILKKLPIKFDIILDPFADSYLEHLIDRLSYGGRYVTCGLYSQTEHNNKNINLTKLLRPIIANNIKIIGNCLGERKDMKKVLELLNEDSISVPIDSIFSSKDPLQDFIDLSFSVKSRLGKVAYMYG